MYEDAPMTAKEQVAKALAERVKNGDVIGLGSGSTAELAIKAIGERVRVEKLQIAGTATSLKVAQLAREVGITLLSNINPPSLSWGFDGADEVDPQRNLIKGHGAAMLTEKIQAHRCRGKFVIIVTADKLVKKLGEKFPVPIAVLPETIDLVSADLRSIGATEIVERAATGKAGQIFTEQGYVVLDCRFPELTKKLEQEIKLITGVIESGLFFELASEVLVAGSSGVRTI
jgi:ribose 5-phosphate isomerase A